MASIERRKSKDGTDRWRVKVRIKGAAPRERTFARKTDAKQWATDIESALGHGVYAPTTADRRRTLGELIDKYIADELSTRPDSTNSHNVKRHLAWWREHAGYVTLDKLTAPTIAEFKSELRRRKSPGGKPIAPSTINRYLASLSAVCKWAWKDVGWLPGNPLLSVSKGPEHAGIIRFLTDDERNALLDACKASQDPNIYTYVMLALATGARAGNLRMLTWPDVDLDRWTLRFSQTKNREPRHVPVVGPAQGALQAHFDRDPTGKGWVFKGARDDAPADLEPPWRKVRAAAGLVGDKHCRFHDLRHTTASYLTMNGATLAEVAEALGHRTLVMAKRYSHQSGEHVRATFERIADKLGQRKA